MCRGIASLPKHWTGSIDFRHQSHSLQRDCWLISPAVAHGNTPPSWSTKVLCGHTEKISG